MHSILIYYSGNDPGGDGLVASKGRKGRLSALQKGDASGAAGFEDRRPEPLHRQGIFNSQSGIFRINYKNYQ